MLLQIIKRFNVISAAGTALAGALVALALLFAPQAAQAASGTLTTNHWRQGGTHGAPIIEGYSITVTVTVPNKELLPEMSLSGAQVSVSYPPAFEEDSTGTVFTATFPVATRPAIGEAYKVDIVYWDGGDTGTPTPSETVDLTVGAVLDSFATLTSPDWGVQGSAAPTFTWQAPAVPPAGGLDGYRVSLSGVTATPWVSAKVSSSSPLTTTYNGTALTRGFTYPWSVSTFDAAGNSAENRDGVVMTDANIYGKVTDFSGNPIEGATVTVYLTTGTVFTNIPSSVTRADGSYYIGGLNTANYRLRYSKDGKVVWYSNRLAASGVYDSYANTFGQLKTVADTKLSGWGAIEGTVVNSSNAGVTGVTVQLLNASGQATSYPSVTTTTGGAFNFSLIAPGIYKIRVIGTGTYATLDYPYSVAVSDGYISTLPSNAVLQKIYATGTVTNTAGQLLSGIWIDLYKTTGELYMGFAGVQTGSDGTYTIAGIEPGTYKVRFSGSGYAVQFYNRKATVDVAESVNLLSTTVVTGINAVLGSGKPTVTTFTVPATSTSTVSGIVLAASEPTYGVTGYMITESATVPSATDTGWKTTAPTSYTASGVGDITLYAWAKGASGQISDPVARTVTVDASTVTPGDSDGDGKITISEVKLAMDMYLGVEPSAQFVDKDGSGSVSLIEVQKVINAFLAQP